jgi:hypothetical protein
MARRLRIEIDVDEGERVNNPDADNLGKWFYYCADAEMGPASADFSFVSAEWVEET